MTQPTLPLESPPAGPVTWDGRLSALLPVLTAEVRNAPAGAWRHRLLTHGALVAVQLGPDGRRIVRIARAQRPENERAWGRWASEVEVFQRHLGIGTWQPQQDEEASGAAVRFLELWPGEVAPGKAVCGRCKALIPFSLLWGKAQRCEHCARLDGDDETRAIRTHLEGKPNDGHTA
jgi:hypothetical protein